VEHVTHFFLGIIDKLGYAGLFVVMVLGNMGVPIGAELVVATAGALAATGHLSSVWLTGLVATLGEIVGGSILYAIGYVGGEPFVARFGRYVKVDAEKLAAFDRFYERHGPVIVFVCRFVPLVRGIAALPAGVSRMSKRYFLAYTAAGSAVFCFGLAYLGSVFGHHLDAISPIIHHFSTAFIVLVVLAIAGLVVWQVLRARRAARGTV
jgi:membrane protein DedA with SNARE-associated domain